MTELSTLLNEIATQCHGWMKADGVPPVWGHISLGIACQARHRLADPDIGRTAIDLWTAIGCGTILVGMFALSRLLPTAEERRTALDLHERLNLEILRTMPAQGEVAKP